MVLLIYLTVLGTNVMIPQSYQTLFTGRVFWLFVLLEAVMMLILLFLHIIFYRIASIMMDYGRLTERTRLLELQAGQYRALRSYMAQSDRLRHDFRHSVHILAALAEEGNLEGLRQHLTEYGERLDTGKPVNYCSSPAVNALFNYYREMASAAGVDTDRRLSLPEHLDISELDLASLFGNLMENAIEGCLTLPEGQRFFSLSTEMRQGSCLYIVSTNRFDGVTKKRGGEYASTKRDSRGTGLFSISAVAERHESCVRISDSDGKFMVDIMLKL